MGASFGDFAAIVQFTAPQFTGTGTYTVWVTRHDYNADGVGLYSLTLSLFNDAATAEICPLSRHEALPISYTGSLLRGDVELWSFRATAGNAVDVSISEVG